MNALGKKFTKLSYEAKTALSGFGDFEQTVERDLQPAESFYASFSGRYHYVLKFKNGYSVSIVKDLSKSLMSDTYYGTYGAENDLWEIAVMYDGRIVYTTPITDDVLGWLSEQEVIFACGRIYQLDKTPDEYAELGYTPGWEHQENEEG